MASKPHRTASIYSAALHRLRERHMDEFALIYSSLLDESGIKLQQNQKRAEMDSVIQFVEQFNDEVGRYPYVREIAEGVNIPHRRALERVRELQDEGVLKKRGNGARGAVPTNLDVSQQVQRPWSWRSEEGSES